jgi:HrpA-like RNA helicase
MLTIVALLSVNQSLTVAVRDPYTLSKAKKKYGSTEGDHITLLNIYNLWQAKKQEGQKIGFAREMKMNHRALEQVQ